MKRLFKTLLFILMPLVVFAGNPEKFKGKYTKEKTLTKEYTVNSEAELKVDNSYGNIDIVTWNENRIMIEVHITTNGNDESRVQEKLDKINVEFSGSASQVIAKTIFKDRKNSSWNSWWGGNNNKVKMKINYTIKLPISNSVDLNNDYGSISINELDGNARINCDYGQLNIGGLNADNNYLNFDYSKNSTIRYMKSGKINADYSGFVLDKSETLELNTDYTRAEVLEVKDLNYNSDYGKMIIGNARNITGRGDYIPLKVATVSGNLNVNSDYGSISIERMLSSAGNIDIRSDYAGIKIGYDSAYNFDFEIDLSYASFRGKDELQVNTSHTDNSSKQYGGYNGTSGSGNYVNIKSDYGSVTMTKF